MSVLIIGCTKQVPINNFYCPKGFEPSELALNYVEDLKKENFRMSKKIMNISLELERIAEIYNNKDICN